MNICAFAGSSSEKDPSSVLNFYRNLIKLRRGQPALQKGDFAMLQSDKDVIAYRRMYQGVDVMVILNFAAASRVHEMDTAGNCKVLLGTHRGSGQPVDKGPLAVYPYEVLVLGA